MYPNFKILPEEDKADLKARIAQSIAFEKQRARRKKFRTFFWSAAAVFCVFLGILTIYRQQQKVSVSSIEQFANGSKINKSLENSGEIKLVLSNKESVVVDDSTTIAYDASGNKISVNNREISQKNTSESQFNTLLVPYGKRAHISLADGTSVWLNSGSRLIYPAAFNAARREVFLEGEGVFDVAHNSSKPFYVRASNNYSVRVLGTLFNVSCYADDAKFSTALLRGKVSVAYAKTGFFKNDSIERELNPGMIAVLDIKKQSIQTSKKDVASLFSWTKGYYEFSQEKLPAVLDKLTRYYNVSFVNNKQTKETYSGAFKLNDDLDKVVKTLEATTGFEFIYDEKSRKITIN